MRFKPCLRACTASGLTYGSRLRRYTPDEICKQLLDSNATQLYIAAPMLEKAYAAVSKGAPLTRMYTLGEVPSDAPAPPADAPPCESFDALLATEGAPPAVSIDPEKELALIPYSSGTSGLPKGVELTHANVVANVLQCEVAHVHLTPEDTLVGVLPFYHIYGFTVILVGACTHSPCLHA